MVVLPEETMVKGIENEKDTWRENRRKEKSKGI